MRPIILVIVFNVAVVIVFSYSSCLRIKTNESKFFLRRVVYSLGVFKQMVVLMTMFMCMMIIITEIKTFIANYW